MPQQDRTGPLGQGPMTGRGLGFCRRGFGYRKGFGFGFQPVQLSETDERKILEQELKDIGSEREEIEKRLKELK
jgi:hypothetical protein